MTVVAKSGVAASPRAFVHGIVSITATADQTRTVSR